MLDALRRVVARDLPGREDLAPADGAPRRRHHAVGEQGLHPSSTASSPTANVLPDIKAALRAKSDLWPEDDKDLLPAFSRLMSEAGPMPTDIVIPPTFSDPNSPLQLRFADRLPSQRATDFGRGG
jgi:hypothetical protein